MPVCVCAESQGGEQLVLVLVGQRGSDSFYEQYCNIDWGNLFRGLKPS